MRLDKSVIVQGRKLVGSEKDFPLLSPSASVADGFEHLVFVALQTKKLVSVSAAEGEGGVANKCAHDASNYIYSHSHRHTDLQLERKHGHAFSFRFNVAAACKLQMKFFLINMSLARFGVWYRLV